MKKIIFLLFFYGAGSQALSVSGALAINYMISVCQKACQDRQEENDYENAVIDDEECEMICQGSDKDEPAHMKCRRRNIKGRKYLRQAGPTRQEMKTP